MRTVRDATEALLGCKMFARPNESTLLAIVAAAMLSCDPGWEVSRTAKVAALPEESCVSSVIRHNPLLRVSSTLRSRERSDIQFELADGRATGGVGLLANSTIMIFWANLGEPPPKDVFDKLPGLLESIQTSLTSECGLQIMGNVQERCSITHRGSAHLCDRR
jgi:hypothetical protein